jgi:hypothetical protein
MPEQTTTYTLTVTDTNGLNCERKLVHTVTVEVLDCNTGSIGVWPNPNNGTFTLDHQTAFGQPHTRVKIYDVRGRLVYDKPLNTEQTQTEITLHDVQSATYVVQVATPTQTYETKMVVVRKGK